MLLGQQVTQCSCSPPRDASKTPGDAPVRHKFSQRWQKKHNTCCASAPLGKLIQQAWTLNFKAVLWPSTQTLHNTCANVDACTWTSTVHVRSTMRDEQQRRMRVISSHIQGQERHTHFCSQSQCSVASSSRQLEGQVAIITGSGQGLGAAAAKLFAEHGAKIVVSDLDAEKAEKTAAEIRQAGGEALVVAGDVTATDFPERIVKATVGKFGGIDILVNNAGYTWDGVIHKITPKQWDAMLAVHCTAPFRLIQAATPYMREAAKKEIAGGGKAKSRCIINVSSTTGTHGNAGQANYSTAKAGVLGLTKTVAKEWGPFNIRCNAVTYGFIATRLTAGKEDGQSITVGGEKVVLGIPGGESFKEMATELTIPLKRIGTPEEAAGAMLLLASPYASFVTGQSLEVTGGAFV